MKTLFICFFLPVFIYAQQKPLSIGDIIPIQQLQYLKTLSNPPLGDGGIILDFFATYCTACIKELPKLDSLQKQFNDQLQVIIVAGESVEKLNALRKKNKLFADCQLPIVAADTVLKKLFPHQYLPHEVWIDQHGKVVAITDQYAITKENILAFVNGKDPILALKKDAFDFDRKKPLLQDNNGGNNNNLLFQSKFTNFLPGIASSNGIDRSNGTRWYFINFPILFLYKEALGLEFNRFILETNDSSRFILPAEPSQEWKQQNLFSWEFINNHKFEDAAIKKILLQDLDRYLGLYGRIEKRKIKCFAITRFNSQDTSLRSKNNKPSVKYTQAQEIEFTNQPFTKLVASFNSYKGISLGRPVFLDESGIGFNIDIKLPSGINNDVQKLRSILYRYGLSLTEVEREIDMFILSETKNIIK